jgi:hypothetical protein
MKLDDTGTRFKHYSELLDLWDSGLAILKEQKEQFANHNGVYFSTAKEEELKSLEAASKMLAKQMEILAEYDQNTWKLRQIVDGLETQGINDIPEYR